MAKPNEPRGRFAPIPIETTFESFRKSTKPSSSRIGPAPEPTPDASPRSQSPAAPGASGERRRFAPQLIETSRRARRARDPGPATKPTDKTDITPYTKNIYTAKPKARRRLGSAGDGGERPRPPVPPTRRETEEEAVQEYLLDLAAKEAERQIQEAALAAFPNSRAREGGVAHFYFRESSGSENSPETVSPSAAQDRGRSRRKSSDLGLSWWHKHMQEHVQHLAKERGEVAMAVDEEEEEPHDQDVKMMSDEELDGMDLSAPPDPLWTTSRRQSAHGRDAAQMPPPPLHKPAQDRQREDASMSDALPNLIDRAPQLPFPTSAFRPPAAAPPGLGRPFGAFGMKPDSPHLQQLRKLASPPMLGKDLSFRRCPSPKLTKLEPNHPFVQAQDDSRYRDVSGQGGLWHGYCYRTRSGREMVDYKPPTGPRMMVTPQDSQTPDDPSDQEPRVVSDEPSSMFAGSDPAAGMTAEHRLRNGQAKGLHMLNVDERLRRETAEAERSEKISNEFNDQFVTQVYNYLSLGYPATACIFDEELSKISHTPISELRRLDERQMAKGHMLEMNLDETPEGERCPRWVALKTYVTEWARQHPDLDSLDPLAWGVREKKGSWAF